MADGQVAAGQPGQPSAPQPAPTPAAPSQTPSYTPEQIEQWRRGYDQYRGSAPLIQAAQRFGFKSPKDIEQFGPVAAMMRDKGISPDSFVQAFNPQQVSDAAQDIGKEPSQLTHRDIETMLGEKVSKMKADWVREQAQAQYDAAMEREYKLTESDEFLDGALGDLAAQLKDNKEGREFLKYAIMGRHAFGPERQVYGDDHPLSRRAQPAGDEGLGKIRGWVGGSMKALVTGLKASQAAAIGRAATQSVAAGTVSGNGSNQGAPQNQRRAGHLPTREELQAALDQRIQQREARGG